MGSSAIKYGKIKKEGNMSIADLIEGKVVALVGPSRHLDNTAYGHEIDRADIVVRLNLCWFPMSILHTGLRTDIAYLGGGGTLFSLPTDRGLDRVPKLLLATSLGEWSELWPFHEPIFSARLRGYDHDLKKATLKQWHAMEALVDRRFHPMIGTYTLFDILTTMKPKKVKVYGIDFHKYGHSINFEYYAPHANATIHNATCDKQIFRYLFRVYHRRLWLCKETIASMIE